MRGRVIKQINNIKLLYLANYKQFAIIKKTGVQKYIYHLVIRLWDSNIHKWILEQNILGKYDYKWKYVW